MLGNVSSLFEGIIGSLSIFSKQNFPLLTEKQGRYETFAAIGKSTQKPNPVSGDNVRGVDS